MGKRKLAKVKPKDPADLGPEVRQENGTVELDMRAAFRRGRNKIECRLDWYYDRGFIAKVHHNAGMLFRQRYLVAISQPNVTARYSDLGGRGIEEWSAARIAALSHIRGVLDAITRQHGAKYTQIIERVAGTDEWAGVGNLWVFRDALKFLAEAWQVGEEVPLELAA